MIKCHAMFVGTPRKQTASTETGRQFSVDVLSLLAIRLDAEGNINALPVEVFLTRQELVVMYELKSTCKTCTATTAHD